MTYTHKSNTEWLYPSIMFKPVVMLPNWQILMQYLIYVKWATEGSQGSVAAVHTSSVYICV